MVTRRSGSIHCLPVQVELVESRDHGRLLLQGSECAQMRVAFLVLQQVLVKILGFPSSFGPEQNHFQFE